MEDNKNTRGSDKTKNYTLAIIRSDDFTNLVSELRKKYNIPRTGFVYPKKQHELLAIPKEWKNKKSEDHGNILVDIKSFCFSKEIYLSMLFHSIYDFIVYNIRINPSGNVCLLVDNKNRDNKMKIADSNSKIVNAYLDFEEHSSYPLSIAISPYASIRDITNFIEKRSAKIKEIQEKYKKDNSKYSKFRNKDAIIQKRNDFIYKHRNLSMKEISRLASKKFPKHTDFINEASVGKIISLEKKIRKEV